MLNRLPAALPPLREMLHDIGNPPPAAVARALGVSTRSVRRWLATGRAPRPAALALFWLTRWGISLADCEAGRAAVMASAAAPRRPTAAPSSS